MTTIRSEIAIAAPKEKVWETIADLGGIYKFHLAVNHSYYTSDKKDGIGAARVCEFTNGGAISETVVDWQDGRSLTLSLNPLKKMPPFSTKSSGTLCVSERDGSAVVTMEMNYSLRFGILGRLMDAMMVRREFTKIVPKVLAGLKHHVETGELENQEVAGRLGDPAKVYA